MNQMILKGKWRQARGLARENWGRLTNDDSQRYGGKADRFLGNIEERFGHTRSHAERDFKNFLDQTPISQRDLFATQHNRPFLMRQPWIFLAVVGAAIMAIRVLTSGDGHAKHTSSTREKAQTA
ncbi:MAG: CsbD family protein [Caldilineaceae bacterium]|nr:CsbD family protein [Caldilineaceae bacterium]